MQSEKITPDNVAGLEWDEEHFKYCTFSGLEMEGHTICSDFVGCTFENVYWYWGLFSETNFIACHFNECTFAGTAFPGSRFIDCNLRTVGSRGQRSPAVYAVSTALSHMLAPL